MRKAEYGPHIIASMEVQRNEELHKQAPDLYPLEPISVLFCRWCVDQAAIVILRKNKPGAQWRCIDCIKKLGELDTAIE